MSIAALHLAALHRFDPKTRVVDDARRNPKLEHYLPLVERPATPRTPSPQIKSVSYDKQTKLYVWSPYDGFVRLPPPMSDPFTCIDYRCGANDYTTYPQRADPRRPHLPWIRDRVTGDSFNATPLVAYIFQPDDWFRDGDSGDVGWVSLGLRTALRESYYSVVKDCRPLFDKAVNKSVLPLDVVDGCARALCALDASSMTFLAAAEHVTVVQKGIAELEGFYLFRQDVEYNYYDETYTSDVVLKVLGMFTEDKDMWLRLYRLGIPVALLHKELPPGFRQEDVIEPPAYDAFVQCRPLDGPLALRSTRSISPDRRRSRSASPERLAHRADHNPGFVAPPRGKLRREPDAFERRVFHDHYPSTRVKLEKYFGNELENLPRWYPSPPKFLQGIVENIDRSEERAMVLSRSDIRSSVPQNGKFQRIQCMLPPLHLFLKGATLEALEKNLTFRLRNWVAARPVWYTRLTYELPDVQRNGGLQPTIWEQILDAKFKSNGRRAPSVSSDARLRCNVEEEEEALQANRRARDLQQKEEAEGLRLLGHFQALQDPDEREKRLRERDERRKRFEILAAQERQAQHVVRAYTITAEPGRNDLTEIQRHLAMPPTLAGFSHWVEEEAEEFVMVQTTARLAELRGDAEERYEEWHDYENKRRLYFDRTRNETSIADEWPTTLPGGLPGQRAISKDAKLIFVLDPKMPHLTATPTKYIWLPERVAAAHKHMEYMLELHWFDNNGEATHATDIPAELSGKTLGEIEKASLQLNILVEKGVWKQEQRWSQVFLYPWLAKLKTHSPLSPPPSPPPRPKTPIPTDAFEPLKPAPFPVQARKATDGKYCPLYGWHDPVPNGFSLESFWIGPRRMAAAELERAEVREFLLWELEEAAFRFELRALDMRILEAEGLWDDLGPGREQLWFKCWGGKEGFIPGGVVKPYQTHELLPMRLGSIHAMLKMMLPWPRYNDRKTLEMYTRKKDGMNLEELAAVEVEMWQFYAQSYYDYFAVTPVLPKSMPENPALVPRSSSPSTTST
ncbi:hypothetical protein EXIGLDRAFT_782832 [Exidia glandulosa HHB12029]|uniref:Uncharacterized protein n=1 Tax=Exidia glandulosa HHB12029 TaxID=1314781 RepID=A0A166NEV1_EXIGL|nr:hypothetical protein EXIGLDRAFT_782832 [Exidia glandulosa HHB12029]